MISKEQVEHMAKLARIELTDQEKEKFTKELSSILDYIDKLNKVDTSNIERVEQITGLEGVVRKDEVPKFKDAETRNKILEEAPERKGDYIKVPKILD